MSPPTSHPPVQDLPAPADVPSVSIAPAVRGCTCNKLRRLTRRVTAVYDRALASVGLRVTQYSLLSHLRGYRDEHGHAGRPIAQLAEALDLDRTTLTRNLKPLVAAGWIDVACCAADGRQRLVCITDAGRSVLDAARVHWRRAQHEVTATIGAANTAQLHDLLDEYVPRFRQPVEAE